MCGPGQSSNSTKAFVNLTAFLDTAIDVCMSL